MTITVISTAHIISICYQSILLVVGVPGNLLIILTYWKRPQRTSSGVFIIALALSDLGVCLMSPAVIYHYVEYYDYPSNSFCKFRYYTNHGLIYVSLFLTIAVAIERYLAVCKPMSRRIPPKYAVVIAALCVPIGYILTIPIAVAFRTKEIPGARTICSPDKSDPAVKWTLKVIFPITFLGGLLVVVVCYAKIYLVIRRQMRLRERMQGGQSAVILSTEDATTTSSSNRVTAKTSFPSRCQESEDTSSGLRKEEIVLTEKGNEGAVADQPKMETDKNKIFSAVQEQLGKEDVEKVSRKKRKSSSKSKSSSMDSTTKMLLIVTVVYFVSFLPQFVTILIPKAIQMLKINHKTGYEVFSFVRSLITINHIINPFVYGFINKRFRKDCKATVIGLKDKYFRC